VEVAYNNARVREIEPEEGLLCAFDVKRLRGSGFHHLTVYPSPSHSMIFTGRGIWFELFHVSLLFLPCFHWPMHVMTVFGVQL
jgi:hypothetical protein